MPFTNINENLKNFSASENIPRLTMEWKFRYVQLKLAAENEAMPSFITKGNISTNTASMTFKKFNYKWKNTIKATDMRCSYNPAFPL